MHMHVHYTWIHTKEYTFLPDFSAPYLNHGLENKVIVIQLILVNLCSSHILALSFSPQSKVLWKARSRSLDSKWFTTALGNMRKRPAWILWSLRREASLGERQSATTDEEHVNSPWCLLPSHTVGLSLIKIMPYMVIHPPNKFSQLVFERKCRVFPGLWISVNTYDHFNRETYQGLDS